MESITHIERYWPHEISTKYYAVRLYRSVGNVSFVCRRYKISKASLMRWNKAFDGTRESLMPKSHRPHTPHPSAHTPEELKWISDYHRRNPNISLCEMYGKLRKEKGYSRHPGSLYRIFVRLGYRKSAPSTKKISKHLGHYDTPEKLGEKWQMDVKYVPTACYAGTDGERFFQYTMLEEASRKRFVYAYREQSSYSTVCFVRQAGEYFGYLPKVIQTDNGSEFTYLKPTKRVHPFDQLCLHLGIQHKLIRPRTPWHNGKVERSHRNDQERFYDFLRFYNFEDLQVQLRRYLYRSNNIPMAALGWESPNQRQKKLGVKPERLGSDSF